MENRSIVLGNVCIDNYVRDSLSKSQREEREVAMKNKISEIRKEGILYAERMPYDLLIKRSNQLPADEKYPQLDPSFLSMSNEIKRDNHTLSVPKFSVYPIYGRHGKTSFTVGFHVPIYSGGEYHWHDFHIDDLLKIFTEHLYRAAQKSSSDYVQQLKKVNKMAEITSHFQGIVPVETKQKIKEAKKIFGKRELFFIAETRPESWDVQEITKDPLVVGVLEDKCYLVDKFDTTPLEEYVSREFTR